MAICIIQDRSQVYIKLATEEDEYTYVLLVCFGRHITRDINVHLSRLIHM